MGIETEHRSKVSQAVQIAPLRQTEPAETDSIQSETECQIELSLEGMSCASCAMRIEKGLKKVPGVKDASVNFATEKAIVTYDASQTGVEQMQQKVEQVGYKATPLTTQTTTTPT